MSFDEFLRQHPKEGERGIPQGILTVALLGIILWELSAARAFMVPVCLSALLAFLMNPLVKTLCRHHVPQWAAIVLSTCVLVLPLLFVLSLLAYEIRALVIDFPTIVAGLNRKLTLLSESAAFRHFHLPQTMTELIERSTSGVGHGIPTLLLGVENAIKTGAQFVLVLIFSVVMLASRNHLRYSAEKLLSRVENVRSSKVLDEVVSLIEKFLVARLAIIAVIAAASILTLWLFGVSYSFLLGLFIGVMTLLPEIGFVISLIPVIAVTLATGHSLASLATIVAVLFVIHSLEGYLLTPRLLGKRLNINVLATFLGVFAGGMLWGVAGMFLSVLILGVMRIAFSATPALEPWGELLAEPDRKRKPVLSRLLPHKTAA